MEVNFYNMISLYLWLLIDIVDFLFSSMDSQIDP